MPCGATQDGRVTVERSDKSGPMEKGMATDFSILALRTPWTGWKGKKIGHWKMNSRSVGAQYATGGQWENNSRKNEGMELKQKQYPVVDATGDGSKVRRCKEQNCIGTWKIMSTNQGKLEVVKQEMARVNIDILGISELRWTGMGEFNSDDLYIYYHGQESLRRNGVVITVNKRLQNAVLRCNLKNAEWSLFCFQVKPFNITVIQVYAPTTNAKEAEVEWFYEDLQDLWELTPKKDVLFIIGDWNAKVGRQELPGVRGKFGLGEQKEAGQRLTRVLPRECTGQSKHHLPTTQETTPHTDITRWSTPTLDWFHSLQPKMEKLYTVSKNKT